MNFSTRTDLMAHQQPAVAKLLPTRVGGLFMDMGTGKSRTLIELARLRQAKWDRLFWFAPVSLKETVRQELLKHTTLDESDIHVFDDRTNQRTVPTSCRVYVVGIESMSASNRVALTYNSLCTERSFVAVDESSYIKGHRSARTQRITHMSARARYRAVLTGTPFTQGAVDLYSQMSFLSPKILGYRSFWSFAANHLEYEERKDSLGRKRRTGRIIRSHNEDYLAARIAPYTYQVRKDECLDLPDKLYQTHYCRMTDDQSELYERAKNEILLELDYDDWSPVRIFHLFSALQTIVCGWWTRTDKNTGKTETIEVEHNRIDLLMSTLDSIAEDQPVIIWAKYRRSIRDISEALISAHGQDSVAQYHGDLSERQRHAELTRWRERGGYFIATQSAGGHGLTLNEAAYSVFYADGFKYSERAQAEDRNHRIGQTRRPVYIDLRCANSIDTRIADALSRKGNALELFQARINHYRGEGMKQKAIELVKSL